MVSVLVNVWPSRMIAALIVSSRIRIAAMTVAAQSRTSVSLADRTSRSAMMPVRSSSPFWVDISQAARNAGSSGSIATMRSAGRQVLFVEPNYLVYALMLVMGIHDLAEIRRRKV